MLNSLISVLILVTAFSAQARKEAVFFGGGGEPVKPDTIFDNTFSNFANNMKASGWDSRTFFDGGHAKSEALASVATDGTNAPMTTANVNAEIEDLKQRIQNGTLKKGDELLIALGTHGSPQKGEGTHSVATIDGEFNVDKLNEVRALAEAKGVKLAILDMSCYSGNSIKLGTDKTCVVSTATSAAVGYNYTGDAMTSQLRSGKSLESAFLDMRSDTFNLAPAAPQISTEAGKRTAQATAVLSDDMYSGKHLADVLRNANSCASIDQTKYAKLLSDLRAIDGATKGKQGADPLEAELNRAVEDYQAKRAAAQDSFTASQAFNQKICTTAANHEYCGRYEDFEAVLNLLKIKRNTEALNASETAQLQSYEKLLNSEEYKQYQQVYGDYKNKAQNLFNQAQEVALVERKVYRKIYEKNSANSKAPNPCKDFVL